MLKLIAVFLALLNCYLSELFEDGELGFNQHIVGGFDTDIKSHPFIVRLYHVDFFVCGGSLLSAAVVISAAHCFHEKAYPFYEIRAGSAFLNGEDDVRVVDALYLHPLNTRGSFDYDIAMLFLEKPFSFSETIAPINLAKLEPTVGTEVSIFGWGLTYEHGYMSDQLQVGTVFIIEKEMCKNLYHQMFSPRMLCAGIKAGGTDSCQSDSGGPMVHENELLGIVSYGLGCGRPRIPGVYQSIPALRDWIIGTASNYSNTLELEKNIQNKKRNGKIELESYI